MNKTRVSLHLPVSLEAPAEESARRDGVSVNQFIPTAVAREVGAVEAADFFRYRAVYGGRERAVDFLRDAPRIPGDERMD